MKSKANFRPSTEAPTINVSLICRGDGKFYAKLNIQACCEFKALHSIAYAGEVQVPSCVYPFDAYQSGTSQIWVLEAPIMLSNRIAVSFYLDDRVNDKTVVSFSSSHLAWASKANYRLHRTACMEIRDFELTHYYDHYQVVFTDRFEAEDDVVWRLYIRWAGTSRHIPSLSVIDYAGLTVNASCALFELQLGDQNDNQSESRSYYSITLPKGTDDFIVIARDSFDYNDDRHVETGFGCMHQDYSNLLRSRAEESMMPASKDPSYQKWFDAHKASQAAIASQKNAEYASNILFSIIITEKRDKAAFEKTVASIKKQSYPHWEIINCTSDQTHNESISSFSSFYAKAIEEAKGDYIALIESGDIIEPDALYKYTHEIVAQNSPTILYCDEDTLDVDGNYSNPQFKTAPNIDLLYCQNCIGHMLVISRAFLLTLGFKDYDYLAFGGYPIVIHALSNKVKFARVPSILYHHDNCSDNKSLDESNAHSYCQGVLSKHFANNGICCDVVMCEIPGNYRIRYQIPTVHPLVSIIIPNKDHIEVLGPCIDSITRFASYDNYEIIIVENNSNEEDTFKYYEHLVSANPRVRIETWPHEFNYSKIINYGAAKASGEYLLFLNNDTEVISPDFIEEMLGFLQNDQIGIVGAKLLYKDGLVQHSGMAIDPFGAVAHVNQNLSQQEGGYQNRAINSGDYVAVTGACQMVKATLFENLGGYDESFAVGFNDVDFCLRVWEAGYRVAFTPHALLHHYEFTSRGRELKDESKLIRWKREHARFVAKWPDLFVKGDPLTNQNHRRNIQYYGLSW